MPSKQTMRDLQRALIREIQEQLPDARSKYDPSEVITRGAQVAYIRRRYEQEYATIEEIRKELRIGLQRVIKLMREEGIHVRKASERRWPRLISAKQKARVEAAILVKWERGKDLHQIADEVEVSKHRVRQVLRTSGFNRIALRDPYAVAEAYLYFLLERGRPKSVVARRHKISRKTVNDWVARYRCGWVTFSTKPANAIDEGSKQCVQGSEVEPLGAA